MRITKVYTRTGDEGETGLAGGQRLPKDHPRIEAFGTLDELNSVLGVALTAIVDPELRRQLTEIQHHLFDLGGDLCVLEADKQRFGMAPFPAERVDWLEEILDRAADELSPLEEFVLPGGEPGAAHLHVARCVARRAERCCIGLAREDEVSAQVIPYLNRLSDALFVMARLVNHRSGRPDVLWRKTHQPGSAAATEPPAPQGDAP
jgi:cob(I)alamin adenosyltransferase